MEIFKPLLSRENVGANPVLWAIMCLRLGEQPNSLFCILV